MSTHATVAVMHGDRCKAIYVHSDGYLEYLGQVLNRFYDSSKANFLVAQGDCSVVGKDIGEKIEFNDSLTYTDEDGIDVRIATQCRFYARDRGEENTEFKSFNSIEEMRKYYDTEYTYVMKDGEWLVGIGEGTLLELDGVLNPLFSTSL